MNAKEKICIALDCDSSEHALQIVESVRNDIGFYKIGLQLFTREGPQIVHQVIALGCKVFLDLKLHDIPNTIQKSVESLVQLGVSLFTIHTSGGVKMMMAAASAAKATAEKCHCDKPLVIGVTVLTSLSDNILAKELNVTRPLEQHVSHLALLAQQAGLDGVVASPHEIQTIRNACGPYFKIITPGIRPTWASESHDQSRIMTPQDAIKKGADMIVIGRPITESNQPRKSAEQLRQDIEQLVL